MPHNIFWAEGKHLLTSELKQSFLYNLLNARVNTYPYPHVCGSHLIEGEFHEQLLQLWPDASCFSSWDKLFRTEVSPVGYSARRVIDIRADLDPQLSNLSQLEFFVELRNLLAGPGFIMSVLERFRPFWQLHPLAKQLTPSASNVDITLQLNEDLNGFSVNPHVQDLQELVVFILYIPSDGNDELSGTSVYVPRPEYTEDAKKRLAFVHNRSEFSRVYTHQYRLGNYFGFFVSNNSWHGVEATKDSCARKSIYFSIKYKDAILDKIDRTRP